MKNIIEILKAAGIEIPDGKAEEINKAVMENYRTIAEHEKKVSKLEAERDALKERAETAESTLKGFEGVDVEQIRGEIASWKAKAEAAEKDYADKIAARDFDDALKTEIDGVKFSSDAAKRAVLAEIREMGLKASGGKILGLSDALAQIKERDASAFVDEKQQQLEANRAVFTAIQPQCGTNTAPTMSQLMAMKNANPSLDISAYIKK